MDELSQRAARHAALGDPVRLAIVDDLACSDRSPQELAVRLDIASNLLAHHLTVLERVGLVERGRSSGDGRRRYVSLCEPPEPTHRRAARRVGPALFVCTANSARSPLAAALWTARTGAPARSVGTHPAERVHPGAVAAARRAGLDLTGVSPRSMRSADRTRRLVITVCDRAHEELDPADSWLHWSVPDPVAAGTPAAFDQAVAELSRRIDHLAQQLGRTS